jgi:hypothetical protein
VWILDCGPDGEVYFDDRDEAYMWSEGDDDPHIRMIWMSGREYGNLQIADWL